MTLASRDGVRRGYRELGAMPVSECFDLDGVVSFEVFAVVCQDGEIVVDRGATDQQIEVADGCALELESTSFSSEQSANLVVQPNNFKVAEQA